MISLRQIRDYYPPLLKDNPNFQKYLLKEYLQLLILDYLSQSKWLPKICFIGGTNLRLLKGIDRFSEDLDFDIKQLSRDEFMQMTDAVVFHLQRFGYNVEALQKDNPKLTAYRRNLIFPELLFDLGLSPHRAERFLIKIEAEDQGVGYHKVFVPVKGCGLFFNIPSPTDDVLLSMKLSALLNRAKGRDFYDVLFLSGFAKPDFDFLSEHDGIHSDKELQYSIDNLLRKTDLRKKSRDLTHLLFFPENAKRILDFDKFWPTSP